MWPALNKQSKSPAQETLNKQNLFLSPKACSILELKVHFECFMTTVKKMNLDLQRNE